jgi:hypothetical protein
MTLLRFKNAVQIVQNLRLALRLAEEKRLVSVADRLRDALNEAEEAEQSLRQKTVITGDKAQNK